MSDYSVVSNEIFCLCWFETLHNCGLAAEDVGKTTEGFDLVRKLVATRQLIVNSGITRLTAS